MLGFNGRNDFGNFYASNPNSDINSCLATSLQGAQSPIQPADPVPTNKDNLYLLAGRIDLAVSEAQ